MLAKRLVQKDFGTGSYPARKNRFPVVKRGDEIVGKALPLSQLTSSQSLSIFRRRWSESMDQVSRIRGRGALLGIAETSSFVCSKQWSGRHFTELETNASPAVTSARHTKMCCVHKVCLSSKI